MKFINVTTSILSKIKFYSEMLLQYDQIPTMNKRSKFKLTSVEDNAPGKTGGFKHVIVEYWYNISTVFMFDCSSFRNSSFNTLGLGAFSLNVIAFRQLFHRPHWIGTLWSCYPIFSHIIPLFGVVLVYSLKSMHACLILLFCRGTRETRDQRFYEASHGRRPAHPDMCDLGQQASRRHQVVQEREGDQR